MMSWQRHARLAAGAFAVMFGVGVYFAIGEREAPSAVAPVERLDPEAAVEIRGGDAVRLSGTTRDFSIRYESSLTYDDGRSRFLGAHVTVEDRGNRDFEITAAELTVGADQSFDLRGGVTMTASDGLVVKSEQATYRDGPGVVLSVPGAVTFSRGRMEGQGVGLSYDRGRDAMTILDKADLRFAGGEDAPPMDVQAGTATYLQRDRVLTFDRTVALTREGADLGADAATVWLFEQGGPSTIELRGRARAAGEGLGGFDALEANTLTLHYEQEGGTLRQAVLDGAGKVALGGTSRQELAADWIDATLTPDAAVSALIARDRVAVTLPSTRETAARQVRAERLTGRGAPGEGLRAMRFETGVEYSEAARGDTPRRSARAGALDLRMGEAGTVEAAHFSMGVRFESGDLRAASRVADYDVAKGTLALSGSDGGAPPRVADPAATIEAPEVTVALDGGDLTASGGVRTVLQPKVDDDARRPALLDGGQAVNLAAETLVYDGEARRGTYAGQARLWQGDTSIQAGRIVLDESRGDLIADGGVRSTLSLGGDAPGVTIGRAETFTYVDEARTATYATGAQLSGPDGDVRGDRVVVHLGEDRAVARLEARGAVTVTLDGRTATGSDLTYHAGEARYEMRGAPVRFVEPCRETTGRTLTFFRGADRILVDGNEETRTQTKGGGKCPDPRFE